MDLITIIVQQHEQFTVVNYSLLDICGTFQVCSADFERGSGLMNSIETKTRNYIFLQETL